ncbi:hypothetical protein HK098_006388 [Nowakowskiella sp. JEL0407]|nr:hypothetical protein HK098_006388 [Nowakowskiella sp. JEL0407]
MDPPADPPAPSDAVPSSSGPSSASGSSEDYVAAYAAMAIQGLQFHLYPQTYFPPFYPATSQAYWSTEGSPLYLPNMLAYPALPDSPQLPSRRKAKPSAPTANVDDPEVDLGPDDVLDFTNDPTTTDDEKRQLQEAIDLAIRTQTPSTPLKYTCTKCARVFSRIYNLKSHIRSHQNFRPFKCKNCNASFTRNHDLNRHERIHSQQKPFSCSACGKAFSRKDALRRHERMDPEGRKVHCMKTIPRNKLSAHLKTCRPTQQSTQPHDNKTTYPRSPVFQSADFGVKNEWKFSHSSINTETRTQKMKGISKDFGEGVRYFEEIGGDVAREYEDHESEGGGEEEVQEIGQRLKCSNCNRLFAVDRLEKHETACLKISKPRKIFDAFKVRVKGTEMEKYVVANPPKQSQVNPTKKQNWRAKHEYFINMVRSARNPSNPSLPHSSTSSFDPYSDYVTCDSCGRRFNEEAGKRHIPVCLAAKAKQKQKLGEKGSGKGGGKGEKEVPTPTREEMVKKRTGYKPPIPKLKKM